jgi:hypothetical protein
MSYISRTTSWRNAREVDPDEQFIESLQKDHTNKNPRLRWFAGSTGCTYVPVRSINFLPFPEERRSHEKAEESATSARGEGNQRNRVKNPSR